MTGKSGDRMVVSKGSIRCKKVWVHHFGCSDPDAGNRRDFWMEQSRLCQRAMNAGWRYWVAFHTVNRSSIRIREQLDQYNKWKSMPEKERGEKPKSIVSAFPVTGEMQGSEIVHSEWTFATKKQGKNGKISHPNLIDDMYHAMCAECPGLQARVVSALNQKLTKSIKVRKAANGSLPGWMAIILGLEAIPSFTDLYPVPIIKAACPNPPLRREENGHGTDHVLDIRIESGVTDQLMLSRGGRGDGDLREFYENLISGVYRFCGSALKFDTRKKKWFLLLSYEPPADERPVLDSDNVLYIRPGRRVPWRVAIAKKGKMVSGSWTRFGNGRQIEHLRDKLIRQRQGRKESYQMPAHSRKGHGRRRALKPLEPVEASWRGITKHYNHTVTREIVRLMVQRKIKTVVFVQPVKAAASRFLVTAGNQPYSGMGWPYFCFTDTLRQKCERLGGEVVTLEGKPKKTGDEKGKKRGARKTQAEGPKKTRRVNSAVATT